MNSDDVRCLIHASFSLPYPMIAAMERLQTQTHRLVPEGRIYVYDLAKQRTLWARDSVATMLGYTDDEIQAMGPMDLGSLIHPVDVNRVAEHYQRFSTLKSEEVIAIEYQMRRADGGWSWLRSQETPLVQATHGFPLQVLGILQDLTQLSTALRAYVRTDFHVKVPLYRTFT